MATFQEDGKHQLTELDAAHPWPAICVFLYADICIDRASLFIYAADFSHKTQLP